MNRYTNGKRIIEATEKAYNVLYKDKGFEPYKEKKTVVKDKTSTTK